MCESKHRCVDWAVFRPAYGMPRIRVWYLRYRPEEKILALQGSNSFYSIIRVTLNAEFDTEYLDQPSFKVSLYDYLILSNYFGNQILEGTNGIQASQWKKSEIILFNLLVNTDISNRKCSAQLILSNLERNMYLERDLVFQQRFFFLESVFHLGWTFPIWVFSKSNFKNQLRPDISRLLLNIWFAICWTSSMPAICQLCWQFVLT